MLDLQIINKIEEFVYSKPRSIQEIAEHIEKNWRTADRYIEEIETNFGTIATRVFRGGTRGALKIVYWASVEKVSSSIFQERLEQEIHSCKKKEDFSAFDIFQYVSDQNKKVLIQNKEDEMVKELGDILLSAQKQILFLSGNLSFINNKSLYHIFEQLATKKIVMKVLCRVDLAGKENIEKMLSFNLRYGKKVVEIRHNAHPLRGVIIDGKLIQLKEIKEPTGKINELNKKVFILYNITDKLWADWLSRIFWKSFSNSIDAYKRLEQLKQIKV